MGDAGLKAIQFFESTNPGIPPFGTAGMADNQAEWIVDLTTKVLCFFSLMIIIMMRYHHSTD